MSAFGDKAGHRVSTAAMSAFDPKRTFAGPTSDPPVVLGSKGINPVFALGRRETAQSSSFLAARRLRGRVQPWRSNQTVCDG